jgi:hypothetical protein
MSETPRAVRDQLPVLRVQRRTCAREPCATPTPCYSTCATALPRPRLQCPVRCSCPNKKSPPKRGTLLTHHFEITSAHSSERTHSPLTEDPSCKRTSGTLPLPRRARLSSLITAPQAWRRRKRGPKSPYQNWLLSAQRCSCQNALRATRHG